MGDVLFSVVNVARHVDVDAEHALNGTTRRFIERFAFMERELRQRDKTVEVSSLDVLNALWDAAKDQDPT